MCIYLHETQAPKSDVAINMNFILAWPGSDVHVIGYLEHSSRGLEAINAS